MPICNKIEVFAQSEWKDMSFMNENVELVQKGFSILLNSLSGFIGMEMKMHKQNWDLEYKIMEKEFFGILVGETISKTILKVNLPCGI